MPKDESDDLISKGPTRRWSRDRAPEVSVQPSPEPPRPRLPPLPRLPRLKASAGVRAAAWQAALVSVGVLAALAYHLLALASMGEALAPISGVLAQAVEAWSWQPPLVAAGGVALRLWALRTASRDPIQAIWIAVVALVLDLITWITIGLKVLQDPDQAHALILLLKVEGGLLLALFGLIAPRGAQKLGETDAHYNR